MLKQKIRELRLSAESIHSFSLPVREVMKRNEEIESIRNKIGEDEASIHDGQLDDVEHVNETVRKKIGIIKGYNRYFRFKI